MTDKDKEIAELKARIAELERQNNSLNERIESQNRRLRAYQSFVIQCGPTKPWAVEAEDEVGIHLPEPIKVMERFESLTAKVKLLRQALFLISTTEYSGDADFIIQKLKEQAKQALEQTEERG